MNKILDDERPKRAGPVILVVEDVAETRDGIERLLSADGYRVEVARDQLDAIISARRRRPDLILVSLAGLPLEVIAAARAIREDAGVDENVPMLRSLLTRLLKEIRHAA